MLIGRAWWRERKREKKRKEKKKKKKEKKRGERYVRPNQSKGERDMIGGGFILKFKL